MISPGLAVLIVLAVYCFPAIIAFMRHHPNRWLILAINIFLGYTGIVWAFCLVWAFRKLHDPSSSNESDTSGGESGLNLFTNDIKTVRLLPANNERNNYEDSHRVHLDELERLATLKERGILTEEEFDAQKAKLLS